jgi:cation-transporting ATPase E
VICAAGAFTSYFAALATTDSDVTEARVSATVTLAIMTLYVLYLVARPMDPLRWLIVAVMAGGFLVVLLVPWLSDFYALDLGADPRSGEAVAIGVAGCAVLWATRGLITRWRAARGVAVDAGNVA